VIRPHRDIALPGQESVWDFPRPSVAQIVQSKIKVVFAGEIIAETKNAVRTIETSHPPSYYIPPDDVAMHLLRPNGKRSFCEWKGEATYFDVVVGDHVASAAAWSYPHPTSGFYALRDFVAFYPAMMEACYVDDERVRPQSGRFYGGWITSKVTGPFKGEPGTEMW
jgi:uncharacterized protein (DUF427 family)